MKTINCPPKNENDSNTVYRKSDGTDTNEYKSDTSTQVLAKKYRPSHQRFRVLKKYGGINNKEDLGCLKELEADKNNFKRKYAYVSLLRDAPKRCS